MDNNMQHDHDAASSAASVDADFAALLESLCGLRLGELQSNAAQEDALAAAQREQATSNNGSAGTTSGEAAAADSNIELSISEAWGEALVEEMQRSTSLEDGRQRAAAFLQAFEKRVLDRAAMVQQTQKLVKDNGLLKKAVLIQHRRHLQHERECSHNMEEAKQSISVLQQQLQTLELDNYELNIRLCRALHRKDDLF
ncbi:hypothetical protein L7F22_067406 [Adiantum nelumboides]|nr:hypothetical protein [Adiantum nelumboides]